MFIWIVIGIAIISVLWAVVSLWEIRKPESAHHVKKQLSSGRVIFHLKEKFGE